MVNDFMPHANRQLKKGWSEIQFPKYKNSKYNLESKLSMRPGQGNYIIHTVDDAWFVQTSQPLSREDVERLSTLEKKTLNKLPPREDETEGRRCHLDPNHETAGMPTAVRDRGNRTDTMGTTSSARSLPSLRGIARRFSNKIGDTLGSLSRRGSLLHEDQRTSPV
ncbi:hypothetical protein GGTG_09975 [Gaeumannomyces tritici R3-111a-1]|uniref:Uncharacterized protein n=1 Tax=Gaeumannomyces tritici (strain R3-111a-1) TaxID=644352 RepID=J3P8Z1_GAET3|nr:hypothetical protein GGTG_09975 [Gaeumannomyces tritici R3-111a-1]EJT73126.1 hypothetical protein GGTG_09975 [Gaeumannomyces tritici R3-111a-1]